MISIFDLFSIGIGPSSSHTVGPMRAANSFLAQLSALSISKITVSLYGSLAYTGKGHGTDKAIWLGLMGEDPETVTPYQDAESFSVPGVEVDILFVKKNHHSGHANTVVFEGQDSDGEVIVSKTYFSVGGGFVVEAGETSFFDDAVTCPYPFSTGDELLAVAKINGLTIAEIMEANERARYSQEEIDSKIVLLWDVMQSCVQAGITTEGVLPGGLNVHRRAKDLYDDLCDENYSHPVTEGLEWLSMFAIAVNEENAAGGRVVTAPTNGAAGVIPSILHYYDKFFTAHTLDSLKTFFFTAGAIGYLFKTNASISGAEMGCQGEVGTAASMAAAGLTALNSGTPEQVECAAEIAMEHHLGLTCDPIKGLVQVPCIERNSMGAIKAVNASQLSFKRTLDHRIISLDRVIRTMKKTGEDMKGAYKETSLGGLALYGVEC